MEVGRSIPGWWARSSPHLSGRAGRGPALGSGPLATSIHSRTSHGARLHAPAARGRAPRARALSSARTWPRCTGQSTPSASTPRSSASCACTTRTSRPRCSPGSGTTSRRRRASTSATSCSSPTATCSSSAGKRPLESLRKFLTVYMRGTINTIHLLPFFPSSSDRGFSIIDYEEVDPRLGTVGGHRRAEPPLPADVRRRLQPRVREEPVVPAVPERPPGVPGFLRGLHDEGGDRARLPEDHPPPAHLEPADAVPHAQRAAATCGRRSAPTRWT
jgi:hypothetical protein